MNYPRSRRPKPIVSLERNNAGQAFVGLTEFDPNNGLAVRAAVLVGSDSAVHDGIMERRFRDLCRLMGDNVTSEIDAGFFPYDITPLSRKDY